MKNIWKISGALSVVAVGLAGCGGGSSNNNGNNNGGTPTFTQQERLARPLVNEVLATVAQNRHSINNKDNPTDDAGQLKTDIEGFMKFPAGRSDAIAKTVSSILVPDLMKADLTQSGPAAYLGVETGGATGGKFGGRKLTDDVVDTSLGIIFGPTITDARATPATSTSPAFPAGLGLVPDDKKEIPLLTTDNVGAAGHMYSSSFPYQQAPR